jgi:DNA-binding LacI/PurR family transcriptional regulator
LGPLVGQNGRLPITALLTLGVSDTLGVTQALQRMGIRWPEDVSLVVLGHRDVPSEHLGVMTIAGSSHAEAAQSLVETIVRRIDLPDLPPQIGYLRCEQVVRSSTAPVLPEAC